MYQITDEQFSILREGLAAGKLLIDKLLPELKAHRMVIPNTVRWIGTTAPAPLHEAYNELFDIERAHSAGVDVEEKPESNDKVDFDVKMIRNELENVCAIVIPDLFYEFAVMARELPTLSRYFFEHSIKTEDMGEPLTWAFETGRRYGLLEAIAVASGTYDTAKDFTVSQLETQRDKTLEQDFIITKNEDDPKTPFDDESNARPMPN